MHYSPSSMSQGERFQTYYNYFRLSSVEEVGTPLQTQQRSTDFPPGGPFPPEKAIWVKTILKVCEGESLRSDGFFEPAASAAVMRFQQKFSLPVTGGFD